MVAAGFVGTAKNNRNTVTEIANRVREASSTRRITNRNITVPFRAPGRSGPGQWSRGRPARKPVAHGGQRRMSGAVFRYEMAYALTMFGWANSGLRKVPPILL